MTSYKILGLDIGGANTKAALIIADNLKIQKIYSYIEYFPFWEKSINQIDGLFKGIEKKLILDNNYILKDIDYISIAITAELSDAFQTKQEGINIILDALNKIFNKKKMRFITTSNEFIHFEKAKEDYMSISAANWVATALFLGHYIKECILIDAGSTTIDIIPIVNSKPSTLGKTDIERLVNHELVYTGALRATIPSITHFVPYKDKMVRVSFEKFALISDVHRILNHISEEEYVNDTADGRGKSIENCYARLARMICMDISMISIDELNKISRYVYEKQLDLITSELSQFMEALHLRFPQFKDKPLIIITGLAEDFLIKRALRKLNFNNIQKYENVTNISDNISSSAVAVAGALYYKLRSELNNN